MNTRAKFIEDDPFLSESLPPFRMVVLFDSDQARGAAVQAAEFMEQQLGSEVALEKEVWDTKTLHSFHVRMEAAREAADADVILIALSGKTPTVEIKDWASQWLAARNRDEGLVAVIAVDADPSEEPPFINFFYETALSANMDFLRKLPSRA